MLITSTDNKRIKEVNKLKQKKYRDSENKFIVETLNLIKEAYLEDCLLEVYVLEDYDLPFDLDVPIYTITEEVMNKIKTINTSSILGICKKKDSSTYVGKKYLLLDNIQDPGNIGTILRSSLAFGVNTVVLSSNTCDLYNDKVIRASEGAIFKLNVIREDLKLTINNLNKLEIPVYGTDVNSGDEISTIDKDNYAIIMGSEGNGISNDIKEIVKSNIYIKTKSVESLNVAVATSIILYELSK